MGMVFWWRLEDSSWGFTVAGAFWEYHTVVVLEEPVLRGGASIM